LRIKRISVDKLFGIFNHDIGMKLDDRITIIHGPNGYGKTTILRMVNALFNKRYFDLRHTPFQEFRVELEDSTSIVVTKSNGEGRGLLGKESKRKRPRGLAIRLFQRGKEAERGEILAPSADEWEAHSHFPMAAFEQFVPGLIREARNTWRYMPTNEELGFEDVIERFEDHLPSGVPGKPEKRDDLEWLHSIQKSVKVRFIESQRLLRLAKAPRRTREYGESSPALELSVAVHADDLAKAIQGKLAEYATLSQSLDRTFPVRLVEEIQSPNASNQRFGVISDVRQKLTQLEDKRNRLQEAGLLDKQEDLRFQVPEELQEPTQRVLPVYVADVEKKLSVFDDIAAKIDLLKDIVNSRFSFKKMSIDKEKGFMFRTDEGQPLNPSHLSSGEQHMLVLFSELLFRVEPNSLVMIDEPEISLHVTWQQQFLRDIEGVTKLALFDVLIATHSPQIVADRWDELTVELQSLAEQPV
jgi:predicted ATP-binding protein involved in virulence